MASGDFYTSVIGLSTPGGCSQISFDWKMLSGTMTFSTLGALNAKIVSTKLNLLALALSDQAEIDSVVTRAITNDIDVPGITNMNLIDGAILSPPLPNNMAAVIKQITNAPNAKHNGRMFIPGIAESSMDGGTLSAAAVALLDTFAVAMTDQITLTTPEDAVFDPGVISRRENGLQRVDPVFFSAVQYVTSIQLRQQRRRTTERKGISTA